MTDDDAKTNADELGPAPEAAPAYLYTGVRGRLCRTTGPARDRDLTLSARAVLECWPIPSAAREAVIRTLTAIVNDPSANRRDKAIASRALIAASANNLHALEVALKLKEHEDLSARLADLEAIGGAPRMIDLEPLDVDADGRDA